MTTLKNKIIAVRRREVKRKNIYITPNDNIKIIKNVGKGNKEKYK